MTKIDTRYNSSNEITKYNFFEELEYCKQLDPKTVCQYVNAMHEFELVFDFKDLTGFDKEWAKEFKNHLNNKKNQRTGKNISKSLYGQYLRYIQEFYEWALENDASYAKVKKKEVAFLKPRKNEINQARATNFQESHKIEDLLSTIRKMPEDTFIHRRNKAMFSLCLLTSPRIASLQTATMDSVRYIEEYDSWAFLQNPKTQDTKFRKTITAFFIGQCQDIIDNVINWKTELESMGYLGKDYLFPKTSRSFDKSGKAISVPSKEKISSQTIIRNALKAAFTSNQLEYYSPHKFRHSIARKIRSDGMDTMNVMIALSENAGHNSGMAEIIKSYAGDYLVQQSKLMKNIRLE